MRPMAAALTGALISGVAMYAIGTPTKKIDMNAYRAEVALLAEKYLGKAVN